MTAQGASADTLILRAAARWSASAFLVAVFAAASLPAQAAPAAHAERPAAKVAKDAAKDKAPPKVTALAVKDPEVTSSIQSDTAQTCDRSRKRLYVEGEGWIVRRVTTCY